MNFSKHIDNLASYSEKLKLIGRPLLNFTCSKISNYDHAQDVVQDTLLILCQKRSEYDLHKSFHGWAFKICKFQILKYFTKIKRNKEDSFASLEDVIEELLEESFDLIAKQEYIKILNNNLPPKQKQIFSHFLKGISRREIRLRINMSENIFNQNYRRLILNSQKILQKYDQKIK